MEDERGTSAEKERAVARSAILFYILAPRRVVGASSVGSISNMLINDPFERWISGVGFVCILFRRRRRRPTFECQKERARYALAFSRYLASQYQNHHTTPVVGSSASRREKRSGGMKREEITQIDIRDVKIAECCGRGLESNLRRSVSCYCLIFSFFTYL